MSAELDIAERLDRALSRPGSPVDIDVAPLVVLAARIRGLTQVRPTAEFVDALDERLRRQAEARRARSAPKRAPLFAGLRQWAMRGAAVAAVTAALMLAGWGTVQAAHGSLPGHPLYGLKRAMEAIQLAYTTNPSEQADIHLLMMSERFEEAFRLAEQGQSVPLGLLAEASGSLGAALGVIEGLPPESREDVADHLMDVFARQEQRLRDMRAAPTSANRQGLERALQAVEDRIKRFGSGMPGQGPPHGVTLGPPHEVPVGGPFALDLDIAQIKEAKAALRQAQENERAASQIVGKYTASDDEVWALYYGECNEDWKCVRKHYQDLERENRGKGRPESPGAQGQGKPADPGSQGQGKKEGGGPPFDDGPPGQSGDGPPGQSGGAGPP